MQYDTGQTQQLRSLFGAWLAATAPYGLDDLYAGIVWPTVHFRGAKRRQFTERVRNMRRI